MELSLAKVNSAVEKTKQKLIHRWNTKGGYENFGQTEVRRLRDRFVDMSDYSPTMKSIRTAINKLDDWAMEYDGSPNQFD